MAEVVKRTYSSQLRAAQARQTRRAIVEAGVQLFTSNGFGRTTVDDIAEAAGVSRKTVFSSAGGKAEILKLAIDWAIVGDDEPVPLADRPIIQQAIEQTDPDVIIGAWASLVCEISQRLASLAWVLVSAAGIDPQAQKLLDLGNEQRLIGARAFVNHLAKQGGLRDGLSIDEAVDIVWVHNDPILYHRLVQQRGWSISRYEAWLNRTMQLQLRYKTSRPRTRPARR
jgi:AcrR family transcriptional regulator